MTIQEIIYLIFILIYGWTIISIIINKITIEEHLGLSILLGFGVHSLFYFIFVIWLRAIDVNNLVFLIMEIIISVLIFLSLKKKTNHEKVNNNKKLSWLKALLISVSSIALTYTFVQCIYWPVYEPDALYLYDFRAQRLLKGDLFTFFNGASFYKNGSYPPFTSLMHFFLYQTGVSNPRIFYFLVFLALYLVILGYVKRVAHSNLLGTLAGTAVIITPSILWNSILAEPNVTLTAFISLAALYLFGAEESINRSFWSRAILGGLLLGLSAWTRIEPFWLVPALLFIVKSVFKKRFKVILFFCAILIPIVYLWPISLQQQIPLEKVGQLAETTQSTTAPPIFTITPGFVVRTQINAMLYYNPAIVTQVLQYFFKSFYQSWGLLLPLFLIIVISESVIYKRFLNWIQFLTVSLSLMLVVAVVNFSYIFSAWKSLDSSVYRMAIMVIPLYWVTIITSKIWSKFNVFRK